MKKGKITMTITIGLTCFILSLVMFMQFKVIKQTDITSIETMREDELRTYLSTWKSKYEEIDKKYQDTITKIEEYKTKQESNEETSGVLEQELEQINKELGKTDIQGEGIVISLPDNNEDKNLKISASDLLILVNALKHAGAEAISINDERITNISAIVDIAYIVNDEEDSYVKINGQRILAPYIIKAVGNSSYLESELIGKGGYVDELRNLGQEVNISKESRIKIAKYEGEIKTKYINKD